MWFVNKKQVKTVGEAISQFTQVMDGIAQTQKEIQSKAETEIEIMEEKLRNQREIQRNAINEGANAVTAKDNLVKMLTQGMEDQD